MKKIFKNLIFSLCSIVLCFGLVFVNAPKTLQKSYAYSVSAFEKQQGTQNSEIILSSVAGGTKVLYLYPNANGIENISDAFAYYTKKSNAGNDSTANELIHNLSYKAFGNDVINADDDGQFVSVISFSKNIIIAMNNGFITSIDASAYVSSVESDATASKDAPETVIMDLFVYSGASENYKQGSDNGKSVTPIMIGTSLTEDFSGGDFDSLALSFKSSFTSIKSLGFNSTTGKNYMKITEPTITIRSSDVTCPEISVSADKNWTNQDREIFVSASDSESGIFKIEYRKQGETAWNLVKDYAESGILKNSVNAEKISISENGNYEIKVTDNVGNETITTYTESNIDKESVQMNIDISNEFTSKEIVFNVDLLSEILSNENYTLSYELVSVFGKQNLSSVSASGIAFVVGENKIIVPENGLYNFRFDATDEAGNVMQTIEIYNISVDARTIVNLEIDENYTFNENGFSPIYASSLNENFAISFSYKNAEETEEYASITNVGNYVIIYVIDDENVKGSGSKHITINPKQITLTEIVNEYDYSGEICELSFDMSQDIEYVAEIKQNDENAILKNAGEYSVEIKPVSENYVIVNGSYIVTINKHSLVFSNLVNEYTYNANAQEISFSLDVASEQKNIIVSYYDSSKNAIDKNLVKKAGEYYAVFSYVGDSENYSYQEYITLENAFKFVINKKTLTVSANSQSIVYGEEIESLSYQINGEIVNEPLRIFNLFLMKNGTIANKNTIGKYDAGTYDIVISEKYSMSGENQAKLANYNVVYVEAILEVSQKQLVITPNEKQKKTYGDEDITILYSVSGLLDGDALTGSLGRISGESVGYYNITIGALKNSNYDIKLASERFEIVKRVCLLKISNSEKIYGNNDPKYTFDIEKSNVLASDISAFTRDICFVREQGENVGSYSVNFNSSIATNDDVLKNYYIITISGKLEILKADIDIYATRIESVYGESEKDLTFYAEELIDLSDFNIVLVREEGNDVGEYTISAQIAESDNYNINFISNKYIINPKKIQIIASNVTKKYGEIDNLTYAVVGTDDDINLTLIREIGENVGEYAINGYEFNNPNFEITLTNATLTISKAKLNVVIDSKTKSYGTQDETLTCTISGIVNDDDVHINLLREVGENVGEYEISLGENNFENYEIESVVKAKYTIIKARLSYSLNSKTVIYSENQAVEIDKIVSDYEFVYHYEFLGNEMNSAPVDAGEYKAYATFAGNDNYEAYQTEKVDLIITKKIIPITLKKSVFLYNGKAHSPELEINMNNSVAILIKYTKDGQVVTNPIEIGEYQFSVSSNNPNYTCSYTGTLKIVNEFYSKDETGNASISSTNVSYSNSGIEIVKNNHSKLMQKFNAIFDGRKCLAVYEFDCGASQNNVGDVFEVKIKASSDKNVDIYAVDVNGNLTKLTYSYVDGYYVFSVNSLASDIIITKTNQILKYAKVVAMVLVLILSVAVTKSINRRRKNNFFARNTTVKKFDSEAVKENIGIVSARVNYEEMISVSEITKK